MGIKGWAAQANGGRHMDASTNPSYNPTLSWTKRRTSSGR